MELHHPDFAELTELQLSEVETTPSLQPVLPPSLLPLPDENLMLALHAWN
jgi:hypothetical protein